MELAQIHLVATTPLPKRSSVILLPLILSGLKALTKPRIALEPHTNLLAAAMHAKSLAMINGIVLLSLIAASAVIVPATACSYYYLGNGVPEMGGYLVSGVNQDKTTCWDGAATPVCTITDLFVGEQKLDGAVTLGNTGAIVCADQKQTTEWGIDVGGLAIDQGTVYNQLKVDTQDKYSNSTTIYSLNYNGIMCFRSPCPSFTATPLNGAGETTQVTGFDFGGSDQTVQDKIVTSMFHGSILARGQIVVVGNEVTFGIGSVYLPSPLASSS